MHNPSLTLNGSFLYFTAISIIVFFQLLNPLEFKICEAI